MVGPADTVPSTGKLAGAGGWLRWQLAWPEHRHCHCPSNPLRLYAAHLTAAPGFAVRCPSLTTRICWREA
eukprot:NODE_27728_length_503_cov_1.422872.p3 GENE.NODE_27728_length_503_cov_1.422872~~NODE_27728_length_503_cov_1.422872.p3  ORF type:complete len:70 (+),score=5.48 NODE_27728_length_503_cov_1.422872:99-308(+)